MKFGKVEMSRLIVGYNPFHGMSHYTSTLNNLMSEYFTQEKVVEVLHRCARYGINTCSLTPSGKSVDYQDAFQLEGGRMNIIFQCPGDPSHPSYNLTVVPLRGGDRREELPFERKTPGGCSDSGHRRPTGYRG
jgi:hypothetical protein